MTDEHKIVVREREWTDEFGTFYQAKAQASSGRIYEQTVARYPHWGWPAERETAAIRVRTLAELDRGVPAAGGLAGAP